MSDKFIKKATISPNISLIGLPVVYLMILVFVAGFSIKTGFQNITKQKAEIASSKQTEGILSEKLNTLQEAQAYIAKYVDPVSYALPDKNPSLYIISQMKQLVSQRPVVLTDFRLGVSPGISGTDSISVNFNMVGNITDILGMYQDMGKFAPIITFKVFDVTHEVDNVTVESQANAYFASYPKKLPSITQKISKITPTEISLLDEISGLTHPAFTKLDPNGPFFRENPFKI